jgi:hypothetical protein
VRSTATLRAASVSRVAAALPWRRASAVSSATVHPSPAGDGNAKVTAAGSGLKAMTIASLPCGARAAPATMWQAKARGAGSCQSAAPSAAPSGADQLISGSRGSAVADPGARNQRGWRSSGSLRRSATTSATNAAKPWSACGQSSQPIGLSWFQALLLPCCVFRISSPALIIGVPWASSSVAIIARRTCARRSSTAGSSLGPSSPRLAQASWSRPSWLDSPLAWLSLRERLVRSASVKPSCAATKLTLAVGLRRPWWNRSSEAAKRRAKSPRLAGKPSQ